MPAVCARIAAGISVAAHVVPDLRQRCIVPVLALNGFGWARQCANLLRRTGTAHLGGSCCLGLVPFDTKHASKVRHAVQDSPPIASATGERKNERLALVVADKARVLAAVYYPNVRRAPVTRALSEGLPDVVCHDHLLKDALPSRG